MIKNNHIILLAYDSKETTMRIALLDKLTGRWANNDNPFGSQPGWPHYLPHFGDTEHAGLDWFYFGVSIIGLLCVAALSFRRNIASNDGMAIQRATMYSGQRGSHWSDAHAYLSFLHLWLILLVKKADGDGNMIPNPPTSGFGW